jgi:hypothetical protein
MAALITSRTAADGNIPVNPVHHYTLPNCFEARDVGYDVVNSAGKAPEIKRVLQSRENLADWALGLLQQQHFEGIREPDRAEEPSLQDERILHT